MDCKILDGTSTNNTIKDTLIGLTCANQDIALFEFGNIVVQKDYTKTDTVRIISGGSNFLGEYVGQGMLTAAVQGENFMSPPSKMILRTIRELSVNNSHGCLLIVPANTGDLLNFGLATERALNDDIRVKLLSVSDSADKKLSRISRTGLSGIILVLKIAGCLSEMGKSLLDIFSFCEEVTQNIISFEIVTSTIKNDKLTKIVWDKILELGAKKSSTRASIRKDICQNIINEICEENPDLEQEREMLFVRPNDKVIVLLNNMGGMGKTEEFIFLRELLNILETLEVQVARFYCGNFMKCAPRIEATVSILKVFDKEVLTCLDKACDAQGWRKSYAKSRLVLEPPLTGRLKKKFRLSSPIKGPKLPNRTANILLLSTQFACDALISCERQLNIFDSEVGDGDTGTRLKNAAKVLLKRMENDKLISNYPFTFFESMSKLLENTVGGSSGCIYSILFEAAGNCFGAFCENEEVTPMMWLKSLEVAGKALKRYGNIEYGEGTMYDPIYLCAVTVREELEANTYFIEAFGKGVAAAEDIAQKSKKFKQRYPDAGAHAVGIWMRAVFEGVKLRCPVD